MVLSAMQSVSGEEPMARSRSQAGHLTVRQSTNHAPVPIAAGGVLVRAAVFDVLSGVALLGSRATDGVGGVLAASVAVGIASVGGGCRSGAGIRRSRGLR